MTHRGKIGKLPFSVRQEINQRLLDNEDGKKIVAWINATAKLRGGAAVTQQNLSRHRAGEFAEWLKSQAKVEDRKALAEKCFRIANAGGDPVDLPASIAGGQIMEALEDFNPDLIKDLLREDPKNYLELIGNLARLQKSKADSERVKITARQNDLRLDQNERKLALDIDRYQIQFCERFKKFYKDQRAIELLENKKIAPPVQMQKLRELMFGPLEPGDRGYVEEAPKK